MLRVAQVAVLAIYIPCVALIAKYAPGETDVKKIRDPHIRRSMKVQSLIWVSVFFIAAALMNGRLPEIAFVIAATALITCCFVHPVAYRLFGFDPVTKEALRLRW